MRGIRCARWLHSGLLLWLLSVGYVVCAHSAEAAVWHCAFRWSSAHIANMQLQARQAMAL